MLLVLLVTVDFAATLILIGIWSGVEGIIEVNPLMAMALVNFNLLGLAAYKLLTVSVPIVLFLFYLRRGANSREVKIVNRTLPCLVIVMAAIVTYNLIGILVGLAS